MTATGALRSVSIAGSATLTTDSSTNAMVEPRMVTARTQNFWRATQFGSGRTERIAAWSPGRALGLIMADNHSNEIRHFACRHHTDRKTAEHLHPPPNHRRPPPS